MKSYIWQVVFLTFFGLHGLFAQMKKEKQEPDFKAKTLEMIKLVDNEIYKGNYDQAVFYAIDAVNAANAADQETLAKSLITLSNAYTYKKNYLDALEYAIQAIVVQENNASGSHQTLADAYFQAGKVYHAWGILQKSVEYFQKAYVLYEELQLTAKIPLILEVLGDSYFQLKDKQKAVSVLQKHLSLTRDKKDKRSCLKSLSILALLHKESQEYEKALNYTNEYFVICQEIKDEWGIAESQNNIGHLYRQLGGLSESLSFLQQAVVSFENLRNPQPHAFNNLGITYSHLKEFQKAAEQYDKALLIYQQSYDAEGIAETKNYRATNEYLQGKYSSALKWVTEAIDIGEKSQLTATLADSYFVESEIYAAMGDFKRSKEAYEKHTQFKRRLEEQEKKRQEAVQQKRIQAEEKENQVRLLMVDKENQLLALRQSQLETEKKAQELELLKREKELQSTQLKNQELEKKQAQQALVLAQQQLENERRRQQIVALEKEREIQQLALRQKELEEKEKQAQLALLAQQNELLERDKKLQTAQIEEEQLRRNYSYGIIGLVSFLLIFAFLAYLRNRKQKQLIEAKTRQLIIKQKELEAQQLIILEKNEELAASEEEIRQNAEELQAINDQLNATLGEVHQQKEIIEKKNADITASINYARRIQAAILPRIEAIRAFVPDLFIYFEPRDIVSGDFYWYTVRKGKIFLVVGDCTGHGVPGAFMSMVGINLLNLIVLQKEVFSPDEILRYAQEGVYNSLRQRETQSRDGMELGILVIDRKDKSVEYAGSRRPLFYVRNQQATEIKADKMTIGGELLAKDTKEKFSKHLIAFEENTVFYLFTDGFQDQFGGKKDTKYGSKRFKEFLHSIASLPIEEQKEKVELEFETWKGEQVQLDDVLVMGLKIQ